MIESLENGGLHKWHKCNGFRAERRKKNQHDVVQNGQNLPSLSLSRRLTDVRMVTGLALMALMAFDVMLIGDIAASRNLVK